MNKNYIEILEGIDDINDMVINLINEDDYLHEAFYNDFYRYTFTIDQAKKIRDKLDILLNLADSDISIH